MLSAPPKVLPVPIPAEAKLERFGSDLGETPADPNPRIAEYARNGGTSNFIAGY
jgi:hypothetical protein